MLKKDKQGVVRSAFGSLAALVPPVALMSCIINILALTGSFYMLQVYDRVLASRSVPTLLAFSALAVLLYAFQGVLEAVRGQVFVRLASRVDRSLSAKAYEVAARLPLYGGSRAEALQPLRDSAFQMSFRVNGRFRSPPTAASRSATNSTLLTIRQSVP